MLSSLVHGMSLYLAAQACCFDGGCSRDWHTTSSSTVPALCGTLACCIRELAAAACPVAFREMR